MTSFLKNMARWTARHMKDEEMHRVQLIFPNKRSGLVFLHYLAEYISRPVFSPQVFSINQWVQKLSGLETADTFYLLVKLFQISKRIYGKQSKPQGFDEFYPWGKMIISDFNDIDKHLASAESVFKTIYQIQELDSKFFDAGLNQKQIEILKKYLEHINGSEDSHVKKLFLEISSVLYDIYKAFREELLRENLAYEGMIFRSVNNKILDEKLNLPDGYVYLFGGFNFLTKSELNIFDFFQKTQNSYFFWDITSEFLERDGFEPVLHLKENYRRFPPPHDFSMQQPALKNTRFHLIRANGLHAQVQCLPEILNSLKLTTVKDEIPFDSCLIMLPDENMLIPVLRALPAQLPALNITMGFPVLHSTFSQFISSVLLARKKFRDAETLNAANIKSPDDIPFQLEELWERWTELTSGDTTLQFQIFCKFWQDDDNGNFIRTVKEAIAFYLTGLDDDQLVEKETAYHLQCLYTRLDDLLTRENIQLGSSIAEALIRQILKSESVPFEGEPLAGIQIMGVLESRCLHFDNIIILNMNEGVFPAHSRQASYIPYAVRKAFGLSVYEHEDYIASYYFYRLLPGTENVYMLYNTQPDFNGGEPSRFISQIMYDFQLPLKIYETTFDFNELEPLPPQIPSPEIEEALNRFTSVSTSDALSPTALITYLNCKLKFYYRYILRLEPEEEKEGEITDLIIGNIVHRTLERLYEPYKNRMVTEQHLAAIEKELDHVFQKEVRNILEESGIKSDTLINKLKLHQSREFISSILKKDKSQPGFTLLSLEKKYEYQLPVSISGKELRIKFQGKIDRIDRINGILRLIDYKTGKTELKAQAYDWLFDAENDKRNEAFFQLMTYAWLYFKNEHPALDLQPHLYSALNFQKNEMESAFVSENREKTPIILRGESEILMFEEHLKKLVQEMMSKENNFQANDNNKICSYCGFKRLCNR